MLLLPSLRDRIIKLLPLSRRSRSRLFHPRPIRVERRINRRRVDPFVRPPSSSRELILLLLLSFSDPSDPVCRRPHRAGRSSGKAVVREVGSCPSSWWTVRGGRRRRASEREGLEGEGEVQRVAILLSLLVEVGREGRSREGRISLFFFFVRVRHPALSSEDQERKEGRSRGRGLGAFGGRDVDDERRSLFLQREGRRKRKSVSSLLYRKKS